MEKLANPARRRLFRGKVVHKKELRLPWVIDEATFIDKCTQCQDCIKACETNIIVKDDLGYPKVDFSDDECTDCKKCIDVCEQPLFKTADQIATEPAWPIKFVIKNNCFAVNKVFCQSCKDACDAGAITFSYENSSIPTPKLTHADCTQCGACVPVCPQDAIKHEFIEEKHL